MDQARHRAIRREHGRRPDQDEGRSGCRECPPAPPARGPRSSGQAARAHPRRPTAAYPPGASSPRLARRAAHRAAGDLAALASPRLPPGPARPVARYFAASASVGGDSRGDPAPGGGEPAVGRRADPRGAPQTGHPGGQAHGPAPHARGAPAPAARGRADVGILPAQPCARDLGVRLPPGRRPRVPLALRVRCRRARLAPGRPCGRHPPSGRCLCGAAAA